MAIVQLQQPSDVGTTYKRALERFHQSRDQHIPLKPNHFTLIDTCDYWAVATLTIKATDMRKPRNINAELKALDDKARQLRSRRIAQLGELVVACKADVLPVEELAGALLMAASNTDFVRKEEWRKAGEGLFAAGRSPRGARANRQRATSGGSATASDPSSGDAS